MRTVACGAGHGLQCLGDSEATDVGGGFVFRKRIQMIHPTASTPQSEAQDAIQKYLRVATVRPTSRTTRLIDTTTVPAVPLNRVASAPTMAMAIKAALVTIADTTSTRDERDGRRLAQQNPSELWTANRRTLSGAQR